MKTEMRKTSEVRPYEKNPRKNDAAVDAVAKSIEEFGFRQPIVIDKTGMIIVGHTRWKAAKKLGLAEVPVHVADLTAAQAKAYRIADNKTNELADWDFDLLGVELEELQGLDFDMKTLGFSEGELLNIMGPEEGLTDPDEVPELPEEPVTKTGDLWILGEHRLLCGDSTKAEDVKRLMNGESVSIITDPPYGVDYEYESWDDSDTEKNEGLFVAINEMNIPLVYFCGSVNLFRELGRGPCKVLIWHKPWAMTHSGIGNGQHHWEPIITRNLPKGAYLQTDVLVQNTDRIPGLRDGHSCPKPVNLLVMLIKGLLPMGTLHDPFTGSGTTIIACEQLGRKCRAMEIEPRYVDVSVKRWEEFTGKTAERITGDTL